MVPLESAPAQPPVPPPEPWRRFSLRRLWAYAQREAMELRRDPIRLAFALLGPILLMITCGYGISFDVEHLSYAVLDRDQSPESRTYLEQFASSRYFHEQPPMAHYAEMEHSTKYRTNAPQAVSIRLRRVCATTLTGSLLALVLPRWLAECSPDRY